MTKPIKGTKIVDTTDLSKNFTKMIKRYSKIGKTNALALCGEHIAEMLDHITNLPYRKDDTVLFVFTNDDGERMIMISTPTVQCRIGMDTPISHVLKELASDVKAGAAATQFADVIMQVINNFNHELHVGNLDPNTLDDKCYINLAKCQAI